MLDIRQFRDIRVLVVGDLMIDEYLWGEVERISPEAPVPVVAVERESHTLGGAGNVINNLVSMKAAVSVIGTSGTGAAGALMLEKFRALGVETDGIVNEPDRPTTKKTRVIASNQQVVRIDKEIKKEIGRPTFEKIKRLLEQKADAADLIILSDYGKGLVTREIVISAVSAAQKRGIFVMADPKGLDFSKYKNVTVLTPNKREAALASGIDIETREDLFAAGERLLSQINLGKLLITCGKEGMALFSREEPPCRIRSEARQVFDVSGAGDTVISILGIALAAGASFRESAAAANAAAGIVVGKIGTATASADELSAALEKNRHGTG